MPPYLRRSCPLAASFSIRNRPRAANVSIPPRKKENRGMDSIARMVSSKRDSTPYRKGMVAPPCLLIWGTRASPCPQTPHQREARLSLRKTAMPTTSKPAAAYTHKSGLDVIIWNTSPTIVVNVLTPPVMALRPPETTSPCSHPSFPRSDGGGPWNRTRRFRCKT